MKTSNSFGEYLKKLRIKKGYSQRKLSLLTGISNSTISRLESELNDPDIETLEKLAPYLGVSHHDLMEAAGYIKPSKQINKSKSNNPQFTRRNEKEDEKPKTLEDYIEQAETLMLYGQVMDEKDKEALLTAIKVAYETAIKKKKAKEQGKNKEE